MICSAAYSQPAMVSPITNGSKNFVYVNGSLYYSAAGNLYKGTSTSAPTLVAATGENILRIYDIALGGNFFFVTQGGSGENLWRSDGSPVNTVLVTSATQIIPLLVYNAQLFMRINSSTAGVELWKMDGAYNISLVKDINPGTASGFAGSLIVHNNLLYFFGNDGAETNLWKSDGTTAGTVLSVDLKNQDASLTPRFSELTSVNNVIFFTTNYEGWDGHIAELWKTDGSTGDTSRVVQYFGDNHNAITHLTEFKGKLYFFHSDGDPTYVYFSVSDGTAAGTNYINRIAIDGEPKALVDADTHILYFSHSQGNPNPMDKFDGTTLSRVYGFREYSTNGDIELTYTEGRAFFVDYGGWSSPLEVFEADLTSGVTRHLEEIPEEDVPQTDAGNITAAEGSIFFTKTGSGQTTLWYYDPYASPGACGATGNILQEIWVNVPGSDVTAFDFSTAPTGTSRSFTTFETSQYYGNNYASRVRAMVCVPQSGNYTFFISSDDQSELYLSTDHNDQNKHLIAWVYGHTPFRKYDKYPSQKSAQVYLEANHKYYIEARHKEGNGNDFISVGWQLPDGTLQRPIAGDRLSAITTPPNQSPTITITSPDADQHFTSPASVTIAAEVTGNTGGSTVRFTHIHSNGATTLATFSAPPYEYQWNNLSPGTYEVRVTIGDHWGIITSKNVVFTVDNPACTGTGTIVREIWRNVPGASVSSIPVNTTPTTTVSLTSLSTPNYYANDYGSRIRGYVCVPEAGAYTFWISGDDNSELWLSTDDDPANKTRIAYVATATKVNEWTKYATQKSSEINLVQGQRYYIEILHKEANGADHVEVGWQLPLGTMERPIGGNRLITFEDPATSVAGFETEAFGVEEETTFSVYPNPALSGRQVYVKLPVFDDGNVDVDIKSITGISVQRETLSGADGEVLIDLNPSIAPGIYLIRVSNQRGRWSTKLRVK
jgi:ELWxxDGT repeat protein